MPGVRRSTLAVEATRRSLEQRIRLGSEIRAMRERRGWTRTALADRAGIGRMIASRVERGRTNPDLDVLQRIAVALDRPLVITFGRDLLEGPADAAHLAIQELILRSGRGAGYVGTFELATRPVEPWRSADVALFSDTRHRAIVVECWNTIGDVGAAVRSTDRKRAEIADQASVRWGPDATVNSVWVVRATARNRALVQRYPEVFASRFPGSSRHWLDALRDGTDPPRGLGLVWCDVGATRLFAWRRPIAGTVRR